MLINAHSLWTREHHNSYAPHLQTSAILLHLTIQVITSSSEIKSTNQCIQSRYGNTHFYCLCSYIIIQHPCSSCSSFMFQLFMFQLSTDEHLRHGNTHFYCLCSYNYTASMFQLSMDEHFMYRKFMSKCSMVCSVSLCCSCSAIHLLYQSNCHLYYYG